MKEDNLNNWWQNQTSEDIEEINEEVNDATEEVSEDSAEDLREMLVEEEPEEEVIEEVAEAVSHPSGDCEVFGSDKNLVNIVVSELNAIGKTATVRENHEDLQGGKLIILCGDGWPSFAHSLAVNEDSGRLVVQFEHDFHHKAIETGLKTGARVLHYNKNKVNLKVVHSILGLL